jgi:hypothetical protein
MTNFEMWAGEYVAWPGGGRVMAEAPECVAAMTYHQGPASSPEEGKLGVVLVFEDRIGILQGFTRAEIRMSVETARVMRDDLNGLLDRISRGALDKDDDIDFYDDKEDAS